MDIGEEGFGFRFLPKAEETRLAQTDFVRIIASLERAKNYDWKSAGVFQGVGKVLASPTGRCRSMPRVSNSRIFNQALPQPDHTRDRNDHRNRVLPSTVSIRLVGGGNSSGKKHACRDEQVTQHFGVRGQRVCEEYVAKFPILDLRDASDTNALQSGEKPVSARTRNSLKGYDEENDEQEKVKLREDIPSQNQCW